MILDNLQIEIQSSSTHASKGIDALAESLGKLKKNGAFKAASTNLEKLSNALNGLPNVYQASNSLRTLANSIEKLKGVGTVSSLSNSLAKLPTALKSLGNINIEKVAPQIQRVVDAVAPLSSLKSGGLSTMVNAMSKLGKVTESLDDETIGRFADKVALLNEKLGPLSTKMSTIKAGFSAINSNARSATTAVKDFGEGVNTSTLNMSSFIDVARTVIDTIIGLVQKFTEFMNEAIEWDGIAARFGRGFGEGAQETYAWIQRLNEEMGINIQQFMKYSSVYATMLTGFGVANEDATKMALGYTELTYDIWAGYNDIYKSFDEASEAVKSAIAGEVEPIRRAGFTIIESTLEQTAANHGLEISLANATEAQKSYLRYLALVDQAHSQNLVGTYAKELNTAEGLMRTFAQQLKSLTQAFGSLFLPILVKVMPYLQAFVELLEEGIRAVAAFFGIEIQDISGTWGNYNSGVSDAVENTQGVTGALNDATAAAKELKNATLGIDELNVISPPTASSGSGGGAGNGAGGNGFAGLDVGSLWDESIFDNIQSDVDAIKEKLRGWMPVLAGIAVAFAGLRLVKLLNDINAIGKIMSLGGVFKGIIEFFKAAKQMAPEVGWLAALFPKLSTALTSVGTALAGISAPVWAAIAAVIVAVGSAIYFVVKNFDELKVAVKEFFAENIAPKLEEIGNHFSKIKDALGPLWDVLSPVFDKIKEFFSKWDWESILKGIGTAFEWLGGIVVAVVTGPIAGQISMVTSVIENLIQTFSGLVQTVSGVIELIVGIFTLDGEKITSACENIVSGIKDIFGGLWGGTVGSIIAFFDGMIDWFTKLWDVLVGHSIVPDTVNAIVDWFISLPGKILGTITDFVSSVVEKFKNLWSSLTGKDKADETTTVGVKLAKDGWKSVKDWIGNIPAVSQGIKLAKSGWSTIKKWVGNISTLSQNINLKKSGWSTVKKWVGSISTLSQNIKLAKSGWSSVSKWIGSMPSLSAKIKLAKNGWTSIKNWLGSLDFKLNFKLPKIGINWGTKEVMGFKIKYPSSFYTYAQGGFPSEGEFFLAREAGPEMVGKIGNRSAVVNNDQIVDAISEGVYAAVTAAMKGGNNNGGTQAVNVYLDGRQITSVVEQRQRERGASIMGKEVYSY